MYELTLDQYFYKKKEFVPVWLSRLPVNWWAVQDGWGDTDSHGITLFNRKGQVLNFSNYFHGGTNYNVVYGGWQ